MSPLRANGVITGPEIFVSFSILFLEIRQNLGTCVDTVVQVRHELLYVKAIRLYGVVVDLHHAVITADLAVELVALLGVQDIPGLLHSHGGQAVGGQLVSF